MEDILRGLRSVQQQIDLLMEQLKSMAPDCEDRVAEVCASLGQKPMWVAEPTAVRPYEPLIPGFWLGFAKTEQVSICQHLRSDSGSEARPYAWTISTGPDFQSEWLTVEFPLTRAELVMNRSLSINVELSSSVAGNLQFAVKSHGKNIEPKFTELVKYELTSGTLQIVDIVSLIRAVTELNDQYDDVRILAVLPPAPSATFTFSRFLISLV